MGIQKVKHIKRVDPAIDDVKYEVDNATKSDDHEQVIPKIAILANAEQQIQTLK